jgi:hypothetical protein
MAKLLGGWVAKLEGDGWLLGGWVAKLVARLFATAQQLSGLKSSHPLQTVSVRPKQRSDKKRCFVIKQLHNSTPEKYN